MSALTTIYIGEPDIPAGMTIGEYRRSRAAHVAWWRRKLGRRGRLDNDRQYPRRVDG